ncbi:Cdc25 family phosphatase-like protein Ibp1 [Venturia nashicola]|nr:Cdc25 family phosphatase-like protein Ibp1 [Venturia nashicola]
MLRSRLRLMDLSSLYTYQNRRPATSKAMSTVASLEKLQRETLASHIFTKPLSAQDSSIAVVDVRDSDHVGGHIAGSIHAPTPSLDWKMPELVRTLKDKDVVVFHCALSQIRGPAAALRYLRERERLFGPSKSEGQHGDEEKEVDGKDGEISKSGEDIKKKGEQKVYVLDGGFVKWQEKYGKDKKLTDAYAEDVWAEGY